MNYCIYILKFEEYKGGMLSTKNPLIKVGISKENAETRIRNNRVLENRINSDSVPWKELFGKITILGQVTSLTQDRARMVEKKVLEKWGAKDFAMKEYCSGIGEFRIYSLDRENTAKQLLWML
jgi:hypothetical protein